jgi:hypothetical protein
MKQPEDNLTIDMHGAVITPDNSKPDRYRFYVETESDEIVWDNLTLKQARDMRAWTDKAQPSNVKSFGWELIK